MAISEDEDDEDVDLASLDIEENGDQDMLYIPVFCTLHRSFFIACQLFGFAGLCDMSRRMTECYVLRV